MKWTTEKPKEPGWYWWKEPFECAGKVTVIERIIQVIHYGNELYVLGHGTLQRQIGLWAGPIPPPEPQEGP